jgi:chitinase
MKINKINLLLLSQLAIPTVWAVDCSNLDQWLASKAYTTGSQVQQQNNAYEAAWWSQGNDPATHSGQWQEWQPLGQCDGDGTGNTTNQAPSVSLTAPQATDTITTGQVITLSANASDSDGTVVNVEFSIDGQVVASVTQAPYQKSWTATLGDHQLVVSATDDQGATTSTSNFNFTVVDNTPTNVAPSVSLIAPLNLAQYQVGDVVTINADATDSDGSVASVEFYINGTKVANDTNAPYQTSWTATAGQQTLFARAIDDKNAVSDSTNITISVTSGTAAGTNNDEKCRPQGLYKTAGVKVPYCSVYDENGREKMGADHPRRIIGYFTSWRTGKNGQPSYLVKDIPWDKITHINYAFAHIDDNNQVSVGNVNDPNNAAVGMEWPGVAGAEMDPSLSYKGHFNLLTKFKKQYPNVKTLISIGGWAETGGYFDDKGDRVANGGFYTLTTNSDNSINQTAINIFADSAVNFIRQYGFDGVDIDYEYPTSMDNAGNPDDFTIANARRAGLMAGYVALMKTLREKLDAASAQDGKHYMLTVASPSSGYLLRGMENFQVTQYLDYINIMSYDLHGAWNQFVGPNAPLFDSGNDSELKAWNYYQTAQYKGIGYLNTDWAAHYFRGAVASGRINIGIPYYSRGWQGVSGGTNGLWGTASLPDQNNCPAGTGVGEKNDCGNGAMGINNIWHDLDKDGNELGAGSNPLWHTKNLENGITGSYLSAYGLDEVNDPSDKLVGTYTHHYDSTMVAPWLWNAQTKTFLSIEDEQSIDAKAQYVIDQGYGGVMFWELAGDYQFNSTKQEYEMGSDLTTRIYNKFKTSTPYGNKSAEISMPNEALDIRFSIGGFKLGDKNYPINPELTITNNSGFTIPSGTVFEFDVPTAIPDNISDQSGANLTVITNGSNASGNNIGGLKNNLHRVSFSLSSYQTIADGESLIIKLNYYLPMPTPSNWTVTIGSQTFALHQEYPQLPLGKINGSSTNGSIGGTSSNLCTEQQIDATSYPLYPNWPQTDWTGKPNHANGNDKMRYDNTLYKANWWTNSIPGSDGSWTTVCVIQ